MNYQEYLKTKQLLKKVYRDISYARKTKNLVVLERVKAGITAWLASINNPKLYYVYEPSEYLSNPYLVRLRKEFPDILSDIDKITRQIEIASKTKSKYHHKRG